MNSRRSTEICWPESVTWLCCAMAVLIMAAVPGCSIVQTAGTEAAREDGEIAYGDNSEAGRFLYVNGIQVYVETYGSGPPMLLIHGNQDSIHAMRYQIQYFAEEYKVVAIDSRGHGKSEMGSGRLTYEQMAEDTNAVLERLGLRSVYVLGWSDGGIIGIMLGIRHPEKVAKLAVMGANLRPEGAYQWAIDSCDNWIEHLDAMIAQGDQTRPWKKERQYFGLLREQPDISVESLGTLQAPTLVMAGDEDIVRPEHTLEMYRAPPNAHLCIFPGATHGIPVEDPALFNQITGAFFRNPFKRPTTKEEMLSRAREQ